MIGLKVCEYYRKLLKKYTMNNAMIDALAFPSISEERELLSELAEKVKDVLYLQLMNCHKSPVSSASVQRHLFIKMVADVLNNISKIKEYIGSHPDILKYHRARIIPEIINIDFLREGNFIKINKDYYNIEVVFYILCNEKNGKYDFDWLYQYITNNEKGQSHRFSYIVRMQMELQEDIIPYRDLSITKKNEEIITLLCENNSYCELPTKILLEYEEATSKTFKFFYPMNDYYIDIAWLEKRRTFLLMQKEKKLRQGKLFTKKEDVEIIEIENFLSDRCGNAERINEIYRKNLHMFF